MLGGIGGRRRGDDPGWDGWMASQTWWRWVWVNSGRWWWTGRPGVLRFMGSQRVGHDWATELNWTEVVSSSTLIDNTKLFSKVVVPTCSHPQQMGISLAPYPCQHCQSVILASLWWFFILCSYFAFSLLMRLSTFSFCDIIVQVSWPLCSRVVWAFFLLICRYFKYIHILNMSSLLAVHVAQSSFSCLPIHP